jgi:hypothetical protein
MAEPGRQADYDGRGVRTFAQGFGAVLLALYLTELEFSLVLIGAFLSVGVAFFAFPMSLFVGRAGRRNLLIFYEESVP